MREDLPRCDVLLRSRPAARGQPATLHLLPRPRPGRMMSWGVESVVVVPVLAAAALYLRGWSALSWRLPQRFGTRHLVAFTAGLASITIAASSLLDALGHRFLPEHTI